MNQYKYSKLRSHFDETALEYTISQFSEDYFGKVLYTYAKDLIKEANSKCDKFIDFKYYLKYRKYTLYSMYLILPLIFLLSVIGFTSEAFGLAWFFISFLFLFIFVYCLILYILSAKMNKQFLVYSQLVQEIIDKYNIEHFIKEGLFVYFRTRSIDEENKIGYKKPNINQKNKETQEVTIKFKFVVQSRLIRMIRNFFWIEFLKFKVKNDLPELAKIPSPEKYIKATPEKNINYNYNIKKNVVNFDDNNSNEPEENDYNSNQSPIKNEGSGTQKSHYSKSPDSIKINKDEDYESKNQYETPDQRKYSASPNVLKFDESNQKSNQTNQTYHRDNIQEFQPKNSNFNEKNYFDEENKNQEDEEIGGVIKEKFEEQENDEIDKAYENDD